MKKEPVTTKEQHPLKGRRKRVFTEYDKQGITYNSLLDLHCKRCKLKNLETVTIDGYRYASKYFLDFAGYNLLCGDIDQDLINEYCLFLQSKLKPQTVNSYMFKISPTIKFGIENGYITNDIQFTHVVEQKTFKDIYTTEELTKLLKRPQSSDFAELRAWAIINLLLATGIRSKELRELKVKDVKLSDGYIVLNKTKSNDYRFLPIPTTLKPVLEEWLNLRDGATDDYLFCNIFGEQLHRTVLQNAIKKYSIARGINKYSLHLYRHTFITLSVKNGMSPVLLKRITGHKTMKMLENYYAFNPQDLVEIVDDYNPLEKFKPKEKKFLKKGAKKQ